jgi:hypothetical protein
MEDFWRKYNLSMRREASSLRYGDSEEINEWLLTTKAQRIQFFLYGLIEITIYVN